MLIESLELLCFGSSDSLIRIYEDKFSKFEDAPKILKGHSKSIRSLAYQEFNGIMVSCSFEFLIYLWNPYLNDPVMKIKGFKEKLIIFKK